MNIDEGGPGTHSDSPAVPDAELGADLATLGQRLLDLGRALSKGHAEDFGDKSDASGPTQYGDSVLAAVASSVLRARQRRSRYFGELFGEPAWDILLDLFVRKVGGRTTPSTSLCHAAGVPVSTATRTIERLEEKGLLIRQPSRADKRLNLVEITDMGFQLMRRYLSDGLTKDELPLPDGLRRLDQ